MVKKPQWKICNFIYLFLQVYYMDTKNLKPPLSLEQILSSYNLLIIFFVLFICLMIIMLHTNNKGFNKAFGYQIFITAPILLLFTFLIKEIMSFKHNPSGSWFSSFPQSSEQWFIPAITLSIFAIGITGFFMMLYVGGIFSDNPPENNTAMILNFVIIMLFIGITGSIYNNSKKKDDIILQKLPKDIQDTFALRTKYSAILFAFILFITVLYFVNPFGIMTNYGGPIIFFILFIGIVCSIFITLYQRYLSNPSEANRIKDMPSFLSYLVKGGYILGALTISGTLIYSLLNMLGLFEQDASKPESWGHIIFNLLLLCSMFGILYKLANAGGFLDKNPLYRLILNTILYIPCLFVSSIHFISQLFGFGTSTPETKSTFGSTFRPPNKFEIKMLLLGIGLLSGYFLWVFLLNPIIKKQYLTQGGQQFVNQPISTDILTNVASYQTLSGGETFDYRYAISFWYYIDAFAPSTNSSYLRVVPILSYGDNPAVKYSSETNTLIITVKSNPDTNPDKDTTNDKKLLTPQMIQKWFNFKDKITDAIERVKAMSFGNDLDAEGNRIIYTQPDVLLQKWNHIVLNYSGGTLDVFYNGKLVKSAIQVVPYISNDDLKIGIENGVKGHIANLTYFKMPLDVLTINTLYNSLKDKNPPSINTDPQTLISKPF
jgi:hypothetical protein